MLTKKCSVFERWLWKNWLFLSITVQIEMTKMDKEKPRALDEKTGFIRSGTEGTRTLDLRLDRPAF